MVLLGALATRLHLSEGAWRSALEERLPPKTLELNMQAFETGRRLANGKLVG
jgi:indolepyruvate ferredoxin oxidoreductase beta subunit